MVLLWAMYPKFVELLHMANNLQENKYDGVELLHMANNLQENKYDGVELLHMANNLQENKYVGVSIIATTMLETLSISFDMVAESTDDRGVTEAAIDSEYNSPGKKKGCCFCCLASICCKNSQFEKFLFYLQCSIYHCALHVYCQLNSMVFKLPPRLASVIDLSSVQYSHCMHTLEFWPAAISVNEACEGCMHLVSIGLVLASNQAIHSRFCT